MLVEAEVMLAEDEDADIEEDAEPDDVELVLVMLYGFDVLDMVIEEDVTVAQLPVDDELTEIEVEEFPTDGPLVVVVVFVEDDLVPR
jgi:hypothetical protein